MRQCHSSFVSMLLGPAWAESPLSEAARAQAGERGKNRIPGLCFHAEISEKSECVSEEELAFGALSQLRGFEWIAVAKYRL